LSTYPAERANNYPTLMTAEKIADAMLAGT
jgi:hypothetical protein